ncbi:outer membrane beta-barrel protein [Flavihumibacter sp. CACIAM 22H1]|uniref:outer membrane beta-barrel protein n=1 Tax=Flavihumibacter sp. CACIAM 22H1 TaxID=1812911 RepID=UPI0007A856E4|nr:outer membrane beta-barrel protein [Flavihumibacter sp. CACIAM 22H1]KYP13846.1 MAG: hypothetical protein A1D16_12240 [Flavihumibacter sp. CACIAM 22H1]
MKQIITCLGFFAIVSVANAQVPKGSLLVGGTMGMNSNNVSSGSGSGNTSSNFSIAPRISYAVANNLLLSGKAGFDFNQTKYENGQNLKNNGVNLGLFAKKLIPIKGAFGWYPELGVSVFTGKQQYLNVVGQRVEMHNKGFSTGITPGLYYQAGSRFLVNVEFGGLQFSSSRSENESNDLINKTRGIGFSLFQTFQLGFDFIIK